MRPFAVIGVMAAVASVVSAGCFHDGTTGNKVLGHSAIDTVCQTFQGNFLKAQSRTSCATDTATGSSWFFEVKLKNSDTVLKLQACKDGLSPEVSGCDHGGEKTEDGWYWKADPNAGVCQDTSYINQQGGNPPTRKREEGEIKGEEKREVAKAALTRRGLRFGKRDGKNEVERDIKVTYDMGSVKNEDQKNKKVREVKFSYDIGRNE